MKVVIIEDEEAAMKQLELLLSVNKKFDIEVVERIDSVEESIAFFTSQRCADVDLVFMDIHLSDGYAFSIFNHVEVDKPIIFTTAYDEYALNAFEVNCIDYILKPISKLDIDKVFSKIKIISQYSNSIALGTKHIETILATEGWRTTPLKIDDIDFFYKESTKVKVYTTNGKSYFINLTLEKLEDQLDDKNFIRANRQYIISRSAISNFESWEGNRVIVNLHCNTPEKIIISRTKVAQFKRWLSNN